MTSPDNPLWRAMTAHFEDLTSEREKMGFTWTGSVEEDPRTAGGNRIMWGRKPNDDLYVLDPEADPSWEPISDKQWDNLYPHASHPPHISEGVKQESWL